MKAPAGPCSTCEFNYSEVVEMGWEIRNGKRVYYRKERYRDAEGRSHAHSVYCGSGERGERAAREDVERRAWKLPPTPAWSAEPESFAPLAVRPAEPPRSAPTPSPALMPTPLPAYSPALARAPRLRGLDAWRALGRNELDRQLWRR